MNLHNTIFLSHFFLFQLDPFTMILFEIDLDSLFSMASMQGYHEVKKIISLSYRSILQNKMFGFLFSRSLKLRDLQLRINEKLQPFSFIEGKKKISGARIEWRRDKKNKRKRKGKIFGYWTPH